MAGVDLRDNRVKETSRSSTWSSAAALVARGKLLDVPWNSLKLPHYQNLVLTKTEVVTLVELCREALLRSSSRALQNQHTGQQLEYEENGEDNESNQICGDEMRQPPHRSAPSLVCPGRAFSDYWLLLSEVRGSGKGQTGSQYGRDQQL